MIIKLAALGATSFMIAFSGAVMPGPLLTITIGESVKRGARAGPLIIVGHALLEGGLVLLLLGGLSSFLVMKEFALASFLLGGAILVVMGGAMVKESRTVDIGTVMREETPSGNIVFLGIVGSLSNPYWIIWWATIGIGYLVAAVKVGIPGVVAFFVGHILADFFWYALVSTAVARGRDLFSRKTYRRIVFGCGLFLVLFGGWFLVEAIRAGVHLAGM